MFDEIEEDEREIRRLQRGELFRRPKPKLPEQQGDVMERRGDQLPTLNQMRAVSEALKGVEQACDITRAKPEFVEFIRTCSPASVLAVLNQHTALVEQRDRLAEALSGLRCIGCDNRIGYNEWPTKFGDWKKCAVCRAARAALAAVEQGEETR